MTRPPSRFLRSRRPSLIAHVASVRSFALAMWASITA